MRILTRSIVIIILLITLTYAWLAWKNNQTLTGPEPAQLQTTLDKSIQWLLQNRERILKQRNAILWHMVQQAGEITGDARLQQLFSEYDQRYLGRQQKNVWRPLFYPGTWVAISYEDIAALPYYNLHFIYAILCDEELGSVPEILAQNDPAFCNRHPLRPACATHQLMGILLLQRSQCGDTAELDNTTQQLQQRIRKQLVLDPRVVDVYMQRVLMLVESGADDLVKPVWIKNLIDAQRADGGWSPFEPVLPLWGDLYIGFDQRILAIRKAQSHFHMTAQGVLLFSLLTTR